MPVKVDYGVKQIQTLKGIDAIRLRPGMYIGSIGADGVWQITLEILSNAIDEYLVGECNLIKIQYLTNNGALIVTDNGRGVPFGKAADGSETLVNVYTKLHTGAKFDSTGKSGYNSSGGMNGVGAKATNALSDRFEVTSIRDGKVASATFNKGKLDKFMVQNIADFKAHEIALPVEHGTIVCFSPDPEIFGDDAKFDLDRLRKQIQELAYLSPGLKFLFCIDDKCEEIESERGLLDYLDVLTASKNRLTSVFSAENQQDRMRVRLALAYTDNFSDTYKLFTNSIPNTSGTHLTGFRTALTQTINQFARAKGLLKEKDENFTSEDLKEGLTLVLSLNMPDPVFSGQTKEVLTSAEGRTIVQRLCATELANWFAQNEKDGKAIVGKALLARKARENARKAKENTRNAAAKNTRITLPGKLADCSEKDRSKCEVFIVEGDSAAGSAKEARNRNIQAVLPIRGKILNVLKADLNKAMANEEIKAMIVGFGLQVQGNKVILDESKLRYGKIIIMADADVDGDHIRCLFLTFIWKFCPELITKGYIYTAVPPLFRAIKGKDSIYLRDEAALAEYTKKTSGNYQIKRFKGLGEMDVSSLEESTMSPENRVLKQITMDDVLGAAAVFNNLMGESSVARKKFIEENAERANLDL